MHFWDVEAALLVDETMLDWGWDEPELKSSV